MRRAAILLAALACAAVTAAVRPADALKYAALSDEQGRPVLLVFDSIEYDDRTSFPGVIAGRTFSEIWLASGGGNVAASFEIGRAIRAARKPVRVPSSARVRAAIERSPATAQTKDASAFIDRIGEVYCASACGMLLAGGLIRFVDRPWAVGLHSASSMASDKVWAGVQSAAGSGDRDSIQAIEQHNQRTGVEWSAYMQEMGVSLRYVTVATAVPHGCMYFLSSSEMNALNVVNVTGAKTEGGPTNGLWHPSAKACGAN